MDKEIKGTVDIVCKTAKMSAEVLKAAMQSYLDHKTEPKGKIRFEKLAERSGGKLDSIAVTDSNIGDFTAVARKYDIDFALKRDSSTDPPTYHVFFSTAQTENFQKAFSEYAGRVETKNRPLEIPRAEIKERAAKVQAQQRSKEKVRSREQQPSL